MFVKKRNRIEFGIKHETVSNSKSNQQWSRLDWILGNKIS